VATIYLIYHQCDAISYILTSVQADQNIALTNLPESGTGANINTCVLKTPIDIGSNIVKESAGWFSNPTSPDSGGIKYTCTAQTISGEVLSIWSSYLY
jgi:hypothetical protein